METLIIGIFLYLLGTKEPEIATFELDGRVVHVIDTPGFDDTDQKDGDVLMKIVSYLSSDVRLSGIIYLQPITDRRVGGVAVRNLRMFQALVGTKNMSSVRLVTTMWPQDDDGKRQCRKRLKTLKNTFWKPMIQANAKVVRCDDPAIDGKQILRDLLPAPPITLQIQAELGKGMMVASTSAGAVVCEQLDEMRRNHERELQEILDKFQTLAQTSENTAQYWKERAENYEKKMENDAQQMKILQVTVEDFKKELAQFKKEKNGGGGCVIL